LEEDEATWWSRVEMNNEWQNYWAFVIFSLYTFRPCLRPPHKHSFSVFSSSLAMDAPHSSPLPAVPPLPASILLPSLLPAPLLTPVGLPAISTTSPFGTVQGTKPAKSSSSPHKHPQNHQRTGTPPQLIFCYCLYSTR